MGITLSLVVYPATISTNLLMTSSRIMMTFSRIMMTFSKFMMTFSKNVTTSTFLREYIR